MNISSKHDDSIFWDKYHARMSLLGYKRCFSGACARKGRRQKNEVCIRPKTPKLLKFTTRAMAFVFEQALDKKAENDGGTNIGRFHSAEFFNNRQGTKAHRTGTRYRTSNLKSTLNL